MFWYCNCGAGFPPNPGLSQSTDDGSEISYTAGYATGLKLKEKGGDSAVIIGCCDLGFEKQAYMAFELVSRPSIRRTRRPTCRPGDFPSTSTTRPTRTARCRRPSTTASMLCTVPGGAHRPVVQAANNDGLITMSAGSSKVCESTEELKYDIAVKFDPGDYVTAVMKLIIAGTFKEGDIKQFKVGIDPEPGAVICNPTPDEQTAMDAVYKQIASGDLADELGQVNATAFAQG